MTHLAAPKLQNDSASARPARNGAEDAAGAKPCELQSTQLFGGAQAIIIHHDGERYTLRRTSKGKLILTK